MWKKYVLVILVAFVLTSWSIVYLAKGVISVIGWWSIQAFSIVSLYFNRDNVTNCVERNFQTTNRWSATLHRYFLSLELGL